MYNVEHKGFASFAPAFIAKSYIFPISEVSMTNDWINSLSIDYVGCTRMMMTEENSFQQRASREYEIASLCTPYRLVSLMLNGIFRKADGIFYKIGWIPLMYHVTMEGIVFNWMNIVANILYSCISSELGGLL